jgi:phosphoglycerate kinase
MNDLSHSGAKTFDRADTGLDLSRIRSIEGLDVRGKRVLVRVDLNVPMRDGMVTDTTRIERVLPTLRKLAEGGAKVVVLSHWGRPKEGPSAETSLRPVAAKLQELMGAPVRFIGDCVGEEAVRGVNALQPGEVAMLENLRFHAGEKKNDADFAKRLGELGDVYVNDAFSSAHRAHASIDAVAKILPAYAGLLMMAEIGALGRALEHPARPAMAIVGGAKVSTKIDVLLNLSAKLDVLVVGGAMANTFLLAQGVDIGGSLAEPDCVATVREIMARAEQSACEIVLPSDVVVAKELKAGAAWQVCDVGAVPRDGLILDFGPRSVDDLKRRLGAMKTMLWNGPLGAFEVPPFGEGTFALAREAARLTKAGGLVSVAGGGDTVAALNAAHAADGFTYVSTAGGAFLEWLEGRELPAVAALVTSSRAMSQT